MRLTVAQQSTLVASVKQWFGPSARAWVFGSRLDDGARGGDFDILVRSDEVDASQLLDAKLNFLAALHSTPEFEGERIDVVLLSTAWNTAPESIHQQAMAHGVELQP